MCLQPVCLFSVLGLLEAVASSFIIQKQRKKNLPKQSLAGLRNLYEMENRVWASFLATLSYMAPRGPSPAPNTKSSHKTFAFILGNKSQSGEA